MRHVRRQRSSRAIVLLSLAAVACGGAEASADGAPGASPDAVTPAAEAPVPASAPPSAAPVTASKGTATVTLTGDDLNAKGEYPADLCGGPYVMGEGMAYQTRAGDWKVTVASETRQSGDVPVQDAEGNANVVVNVNGPGRQFVARRGTGATVRVSEDFGRLEADLELRGVMNSQAARLVVAFECE